MGRILIEESAQIPDIQSGGVLPQEVLGLGDVLLRLLLHGCGIPPVPCWLLRHPSGEVAPVKPVNLDRVTLYRYIMGR